MSSVPPELLAQAGMAILLFIVWVYTFKQSNNAFVKVSEKSSDTITELAERTANAYESAIEDSRKAIEDSQDLNRELLNLIRENAQEQKQQAKDELEWKSHLTRVLTRMEEKLDQPVRCPYQVNERRKSNEQ